MSRRTFKHFPQDIKACPLCGTREDKECVLVPIDGTIVENICEAEPVHVECLDDLSEWHYNKSVGVIYRITKK